YAPFTSVIIPIYNEPIEVVKATLASMSKLEYPEYEIIIADDSEEKRDYGPGFRVIRRQNREGFKGGALRNAFKYIDERSELVAIFDADFTVEKDALRRFAQHFKDPNIGAVQGYMKISANEDKNGLTKFISVISGVSNYILYGRYLKRGFVTVQGTNEVYRRKAIEEIGGVAPYTTVNEDLDTSFRLRKANWKIIYDPNIIGIGLAPETYRKFAGQLSRWTSSTIREYRRHIVSFLKSKEIRFREKLDAIMFLSTWTISLVVSPTLILVPFALLSTPLPIEYTLPISAIMTSLPVAIIFSSTDLKYGIKTAMEGLAMYFWFLLPGYFVSFRAAVEGLVSDGSFNVTDKSNSVVAQESSSK
ncbi:MAG: glycosyltransferase family 2 protein, partial [Candidatus Marsarchaeota archaeon]|nr:glycosyltransferase family 2 protein [Candidatus Marsarchaeota archaeon]MCL5112265.1 glycosyltransferase family 2 protein [Candidatus Marsarchaeota archaeon]